VLGKLVDEEVARTNSPEEQSLGFACEHADLSGLQESGFEADSKLEKWLNFIYGEQCRRNVERRLELCKSAANGVKEFVVGELNVVASERTPLPRNNHNQLVIL
jgi:hypothetical protein